MQTYETLVITRREAKAFYSALSDALAGPEETVGHLLTTDFEKLPEQLKEYQKETVTITTGSFWGIWKTITRNEIEWTFTRIEAIKILTILRRELSKKVNKRISVTQSWLRVAPLF